MQALDYVVRPARADDLDTLYGLAGLTGGGFTNLPHDRDALEKRIARSVADLEADAPEAGYYKLVLEHRPSGAIAGTACLFGRVGVEWPFYSYRVSTLSKASKALGRTLTTRVLHLVNDYDGASEVGGLFLHPDHRRGGLGRLLARARYLFIARHRARFAERTIAELRGVIEDGQSPFWDALAGRFFGMAFHEADTVNSVSGNQMIADLMPRHPVYVDLLDDRAREVLGKPHADGHAAMALLRAEGFEWRGYVDIFDGGPTVEASTDAIRTVSGARTAKVSGRGEAFPHALVGAGLGPDFRAFIGPLDVTADNTVLSHQIANADVLYEQDGFATGLFRPKNIVRFGLLGLLAGAIVFGVSQAE